MNAPAPVSAALLGPAVRFEGVGLRYGAARILDGIDLRAEPGRIHAVVGPNGGGKSSLLRCLMGQAPFSGTIALDWPAAPGRIGYVPQVVEFDRNLPMTVTDFLICFMARRPAFLRPRAVLRDRVALLLDRVGLAGKARRRMGDLSGGERQRVLLAQALDDGQGREPNLMVLDEPMAALDAVGAQVFETILTGLRDRGATLIWVEHDLAAVRRLADGVSAIDGQLLFQGAPQTELTPDRVLALFSHRRTQP